MCESIKCLSPRGFGGFLAAVLVALVSSPATAAERPATPPWEALPAADSYDPAVPTPAEVLGFEIGSRHLRHDELVDYLRRLAAASDRVEIEEQGRTHEGRPQILLTITSPTNLARREEIRRRHLALSEPPWDLPADRELEGMPVVVWLGYSIHGDEASGTNASLLVAYHLAAAQGAGVEGMLERAVVLLDPSLNPDGLARFAHWVAIHRGRVEVDDPAHREHLQGWPSARTNHYWFDLNRDWLLVQHPESRARVATLQRWRPNLVADFHEMGTDSTFFFQPGVPSRQNPLTPSRNLELTREIARFHADAFDRAGRLYYSEETFDDFYYGKGSTYPDVQGAVGILFEQASSRGIRQRSDDGVLTFADSVANQVRASFSTLAASAAKRLDLLAWQRDFYRQTTAAAAAGPVGGWIVGSGGDPARAGELVSILDAHGIAVHRLARDTSAGGRTFHAGEAFVVPAAQRQARLAEALFERRTEFADEVFYDVSAWTLPLAFGLPWAEVARGRWSPALVGEPVGAADAELPAGRAPAAGASYAWVFDWQPRWAPRALQRLLDAGVEVRIATRPFRAATDAGSRSFGFGAVVVPAAQEVSGQVIGELVAELAREDGIDVWALASGLTSEGIDLGSPSMRRVTAPRALLVVGHHVVQYAAGEIWHLLDHRYGLPLSLVDRHRLGSVDLADYTHVLLVDG
ncbi:MAG TPA: M14 metallopeptidase family protein, partial [Thermoanaerobaculia bacterium]|nr:M14 metallopeptidase family protein [Thermoanaerobaculia bacterium]